MKTTKKEFPIGMTKEEAIKAMAHGKRVRHRYFLPEQWIKMKAAIEHEDGTTCDFHFFWDIYHGPPFETGWSIV